MNIHIIGDKTEFLSKNAVIRLKQDLKDKKPIDFTKYLKKEYCFKFDTTDTETHVHIISLVQLEENNKIEEASKARIELRRKLKQHTRTETVDMKQKMESLKRSVPTKIFNSYARLMSKYKLTNMPAPDEVINNVDKYRLQISAVMGKISKVSNDAQASNDIRHYFTTLGEFLGIEAISIPVVKNKIKLDDTDDEDEIIVE